ncbi:Tlg2-vesicle protein [Gaertneriomyces sp. JEL0708]|nr:Tlg2-vesicle protein [Gaertneriomyces sp. JEL0708]
MLYLLRSYTNRIPDLRFLLTKRWLPLWIIAGATAFGLVTFLLYHEQIFAFLTEFAQRVRDMGAGGMLLTIFLVFITCFPPMIGYGTLVYLCGFIYSFPLGFVPAYTGALLGGICCFIGARRWLGEGYRQRIVSAWPKFEVVEGAVEKGGWKLATLIRLAPYPYSMISVVFATTSMPLERYIIATALSLFKLLLYVYIGSSVRDLTDTSNMTPARVVALICGMLIAIGVLVYLTLTVRRVLAAAEAGQEEEVWLDENIDEDEDIDIQVENEIRAEGFRSGGFPAGRPSGDDNDDEYGLLINR